MLRHYTLFICRGRFIRYFFENFAQTNFPEYVEKYLDLEQNINDPEVQLMYKELKELYILLDSATTYEEKFKIGVI